MQNDESIATNVASVSKQNKEPNANRRKPEKWEIELVGDFLLKVYHLSLIAPYSGWCVRKAELRNEFVKFTNAEQKQKLAESRGNYNIGNLLDECGFLLNTARDSALYKIKSKSFFEFRNAKIKFLDNQKINADAYALAKVNEKSLNSKDILDEEEIDETIPPKCLVYQGSSMQQRDADFLPNNMSCFICQKLFSSIEFFEEHIQTHGDDTDFEYLSQLHKFNKSLFKLSYRLCKNSHNFCFEVESSIDNLIIEKIIIVQSRSFFYVHNTRVPYKIPDSGVDRFFVDSHLFTKYLEHPIIIICHLEDNRDTLFTEQHHFMPTEEFPQVCFSINPNRLPCANEFKPKAKLAHYFPPQEIQDALKDDFYHQRLMKTSNEFRDYVRNENKLQPQTIGASLNILLQIEDMDTIKQYLNLNQKNIKLRSYGDEYSFQLKPSQRVFLENVLSPYDEVILTKGNNALTSTDKMKKLFMQNEQDIKCSNDSFVGIIRAINTGRISFTCYKKLDMHDSYEVMFRPSRTNFRYQYRALQLLPDNMPFLKKFLFPAKIIPMDLPTSSIELYNSRIHEEQLQAVRNIALGPRNDATYIIFGPPGTGKTTTLVESILQLLRRPKTKILVTAASNSACDEIALRLCKFLPQLDIVRCLVRIYSRSCETRSENIDEILLENSNMYNTQFYPDIEILHEYRVVICTLSVVGKLATGKLGRQSNGDPVYTHLVIDEVAAAMESESLVAITAVLAAQSSLIIAGDHKQLGPVLKSVRAKELGLDASLMDRLLERDCYRVDVDTGYYDRTIQTRLIRNYRSHPAIVNLYSGLYYNHSLEACAKLEDVSLCASWHKLRNKQYPILFHAIHRPSTSDRQSHSLFNMAEAATVMDYVKELIFFGINGQPVEESDIGIISPYKKQYKYIQEQLNLRKWFGIETGSVETFQGKEKNIIIVSFVRSGTDNLGFLDNPRRLNVTLSRPKCILILIGNPKTLSLNKDFEYIIKECKLNNAFIGTDNPPQKSATDSNKKSNTKSNRMLSQLKNLDLVTPYSGQKSDQDKESEKLQGHRRQRNRKNNRNNRKRNDAKDDDTESQASFRNSSNSKKNQQKENSIHNLGKDSENVRISKESADSEKLDLIFNELPQVPQVVQVPTAPEIGLTKEEYSTVQQHIHQYFKLQRPADCALPPALQPRYPSMNRAQQNFLNTQNFNPLLNLNMNLPRFPNNMNAASSNPNVLNQTKPTLGNNTATNNRRRNSNKTGARKSGILPQTKPAGTDTSKTVKTVYQNYSNSTTVTNTATTFKDYGETNKTNGSSTMRKLSNLNGNEGKLYDNNDSNKNKHCSYFNTFNTPDGPVVPVRKDENHNSSVRIKASYLNTKKNPTVNASIWNNKDDKSTAQNNSVRTSSRETHQDINSADSNLCRPSSSASTNSGHSSNLYPSIKVNDLKKSFQSNSISTSTTASPAKSAQRNVFKIPEVYEERGQASGFRDRREQKNEEKSCILA